MNENGAAHWCRRQWSVNENGVSTGLQRTTNKLVPWQVRGLGANMMTEHRVDQFEDFFQNNTVLFFFFSFFPEHWR